MLIFYYFSPLKSLFFIYLYTSFTIFLQYTIPAAGFIQYDAPLGEFKEMYSYIEQRGSVLLHSGAVNRH